MGCDNHLTVVPSNHEGADGDAEADSAEDNDDGVTPNYGTL